MKYYYGYLADGYGFVAEGDERIKPDFIELEESAVDAMLQECSTQNKEVVCYNGEVFTAEPDYYYIDENHQWQQRTQAEVDEIRRQKEENEFNKQFFNTSLGYVRRKFTNKTGEVKDFLSDALPLLQAGVQVLTYTRELQQNKVTVTEQFINECKQQVLIDFYGEV